MKNLLLSSLLLLLFGTNLKAQQIVNHHCDFETGTQNMWGPSFSAFTLNTTIPIFDVAWNVSQTVGGITTIVGQSFGATITAGTSGAIGMDFSITGFTTGDVEVKYPVDIVLNMPTDNTYDQGDQVSINTSYTIAPGYDLITNFPSAGEIKLTLNFDFAINASVNVCFFGCIGFPIIPPISTSSTIDLLSASVSGVDLLEGDVYVNVAGIGATIPIGPLFSYPGVPVDLDILNIGYGFGGFITVPHPETSVVLQPNNIDLSACGDSVYLEMSIEIFQLIGEILENIPGPAAVVGQILGNLTNSWTEPASGATLSYTIFSASFVMQVATNQCFDFKPKVYGKMEFPVPVSYTIYNGATLLSSGTSSIINYQVGNIVNYDFPCYYETMDIIPSYTIIGSFKNRTWDEISFSFDMEAITFSFTLPIINITPAITIPEICIPIP